MLRYFNGGYVSRLSRLLYPRLPSDQFQMDQNNNQPIIDATNKKVEEPERIILFAVKASSNTGLDTDQLIPMHNRNPTELLAMHLNGNQYYETTNDMSSIFTHSDDKKKKGMPLVAFIHMYDMLTKEKFIYGDVEGKWMVVHTWLTSKNAQLVAFNGIRYDLRLLYNMFRRQEIPFDEAFPKGTTFADAYLVLKALIDREEIKLNYLPENFKLPQLYENVGYILFYFNY